MDSNPHPGDAFQGQDARMRHLLELKDQMALIHARLEYLRLMLRLGALGK